MLGIAILNSEHVRELGVADELLAYYAFDVAQPNINVGQNDVVLRSVESEKRLLLTGLGRWLRLLPDGLATLLAARLRGGLVVPWVLVVLAHG